MILRHGRERPRREAVAATVATKTDMLPGSICWRAGSPCSACGAAFAMPHPHRCRWQGMAAAAGQVGACGRKLALSRVAFPTADGDPEKNEDGRDICTDSSGAWQPDGCAH